MSSGTNAGGTPLSPPDPPLYRTPPSPEQEARLAAMEAQVRARREKAAAKRAKEAAADAKPKRCKVPKAPRPPPHNAHVSAYNRHRILGIVAERLAASPCPPQGPARVPGDWPGGEQATSMGPGFSPPGIRVPERDIPRQPPMLD
jgi:hypothetical protein